MQSLLWVALIPLWFQAHVYRVMTTSAIACLPAVCYVVLHMARSMCRGPETFRLVKRTTIDSAIHLALFMAIPYLAVVFMSVL